MENEHSNIFNKKQQVWKLKNTNMDILNDIFHSDSLEYLRFTKTNYVVVNFQNYKA